MRTKYLSVLMVALFMAVLSFSYAIAAEKRCTVEGKKVECPVQPDRVLKKAAEKFEQEAISMMEGKAGSTYGISAYDYLTGVGKRTPNTKLTKGDSGYGMATGKTELWDRVKKPAPGEKVYNQWVHNWSPKFDKTLVPGADPNEGKQWYYMYCVDCHGWNLQGDGPSAYLLDPKPRILTKGDYMNRKTNLELFMAIKGGGEAVDLSPVMPAWGNVLQDQDIWNIIAFIRAMADVPPPKTLKDYLNPKSSFNPKSKANAITPLNAAENEDFQEAQEMLEAMLGGRGVIEGGKFVEGGLRKKPKDVAKKVKKGY